MIKADTDNIVLLSQLNKNQLAQLKRVSLEKHYDKGEFVFNKGDASSAVWIIKDGRVHLQNVSYDGKVMTSCIMTVGDVFCCLPALDGKPYSVDAIVVEPSVILKIPAEYFRELMQDNPAFSKQVLCTFCDRLRLAESRGCHALDPAELRMARLLLMMGEKFKNQIPLTRQEMAEIAGITVETAIRILSTMKRDGIITSSRKMTHLIHPEKLVEMVGE